MNKPIILLDRDGVINFDSAYYIKSPDEWNAIPGSLEAIAHLNRAGYHVIVVTNQSGIARGYYDIEILDQIHEKLMHELAAVGGYIEEFYYCPHHPTDECLCRKPRPGMLHKIRERYQPDFGQVFFIGDSLSDMQVAMEAGCKPILVLSGNGKLTLEKNPDLLKHVPHFNDLAAAVQFILSEEPL